MTRAAALRGGAFRFRALSIRRSSLVISPLLPTYARADIAFEKGEGAWLTAADGSRYLDFGGGIAVASLGYAHPHLV